MLHFESIMDYHGHDCSVSPWALRASARCTENDLKRNRYGGDAFLLLVPGKANPVVSERSYFQTPSQCRWPAGLASWLSRFAKRGLRFSLKRVESDQRCPRMADLSIGVRVADGLDEVSTGLNVVSLLVTS